MEEKMQIIIGYLKEHATDMFRSPRDKLNYPYLDPGGHYGCNLWDWDSYWAGRAMISLCRDLKTHGDKTLADELALRTQEHTKGCVLNFFDLMQEDGFLPIMTTADGVLDGELFRMYREGCVNQHKPFLCQNALQAAQFSGDYGWLEEKFDKLHAYLAFYKKNQFVEKCGLYVYNNDIMIGGDNNPVVFGRPERSGADLFLNCFLIKEFQAMQTLCEKFGKKEWQDYYAGEEKALVAAIEKYCYDEYYSFYFGCDVQVETHESTHFHHGLGAFWNVLPVKVRSWLGFLPMYVGIASKEKAEKIVRKHYDDERMKCAYGIRTLASDELMYSTEASNNPSNWLGPVWGISNYLVFSALERYGYEEEAKEMAEKTVNLFAQDIARHGAMSESYYPDSGESMLFHGFLNWNILVVEMMEKLK